MPRQARDDRQARDGRWDDELSDPGGWFDTPIFEPGSDERMEALATTGKGPVRLAASALLRVNARTNLMRRPPAPDVPSAAQSSPRPARRAAPKSVARQATVARPSAQVTARAKDGTHQAKPATPSRAASRPAPTVASPAKPRSPRRAAGTAVASSAAPTGAARGRRAPRPDPRWDAFADTTADNGLASSVAQLHRPDSFRPGAGFRNRLGAALDRWAAREMDQWAKAEGILFPARRTS